VDNISDLMDNPQLASRDFWINLPHPEMNDSLTYPGPFAVLSESPIAIRRRAPLIGEHNTEIFEKELRISRKDMAALKKAEVI
jgi:crotonobetainyl-CoA:carnitine CoA-transferase CaiB-like acyl-CoA transferase